MSQLAVLLAQVGQAWFVASKYSPVVQSVQTLFAITPLHLHSLAPFSSKLSGHALQTPVVNEHEVQYVVLLSQVAQPGFAALKKLPDVHALQVA